MLVLTTAVSGSHRGEYLEKMKRYGEKHKKKIRVYNVGDLILDQAKRIGISITQKNILNAPHSVINSIRSAAFERLVAGIKKDLKKYDVVFINIHALFFWKNVFSRAWDHYYVSQLNPDLFLTFIDSANQIADRLNSRKQWKQSKLSQDDVLLWQNVEVETTAGWAEFKAKNYFVIPTGASPKLLYELIFEPAKERAYMSMPLTHFSSDKDQKPVDRLVKKLEDHFVIFDPRHVEPLFEKSSKKSGSAMLNQIVHRDFWLIKQSHLVIAYFPKPVLSPGVINEIREAYETNKETWLIFPGSKPISPFLSYYSKLIFRSTKELIDFLEKKRKK